MSSLLPSGLIFFSVEKFFLFHISASMFLLWSSLGRSISICSFCVQRHPHLLSLLAFFGKWFTLIGLLFLIRPCRGWNINLFLYLWAWDTEFLCVWLYMYDQKKIYDIWSCALLSWQQETLTYSTNILLFGYLVVFTTLLHIPETRYWPWGCQHSLRLMSCGP